MKEQLRICECCFGRYVKKNDIIKVSGSGFDKNLLYVWHKGVNLGLYATDFIFEQTTNLSNYFIDPDNPTEMEMSILKMVRPEMNIEGNDGKKI